MKKIVSVVFYQTSQGNEPVKEWLKTLTEADRKAIGKEIKTVEYGWPLGMPLVRKIGSELWEVRVNIQDGIARVLFTLLAEQMVLLHGFVKKSQKTPKPDIALGLKRLKDI